MHTDAQDPHGQDLPHLIEHLGVNEGQVLLSTDKVSAEDLAGMYNATDFTINISDAEGFGLATLESLSCGTPIIVNMTGGLQEQVTDGENWFGFGIEPASKAVIGSLQVPYIYEDRIAKEDFLEALEMLYNTPKEERMEMGKQGRKHVLNEYGFDQYVRLWDETLTNLHKELGSWSTRKHVSWELVDLNEI